MKNKNGSVVIVSMILGIALAALAGGYIALTSQAMKHTQRTFYMNAAFNLAESGAEYAIWCLKNTWTLPSGRWTGDAATKTYLGSANSPIFTDTQGAKGYFKIRVTNADSANPTVIAEGIVVPAFGRPLTKQIRVTLRPATPWENGLDADEANLVGGEYFSYDSSDADAAVAASAVKTEGSFEITVASRNLQFDAFSIGAAADIYGKIATALTSETPSATAFLNSIKGQILGFDTVDGQAGVVKQGSNLIDTNRIAYDYTADFPDVDIPPAGSTTITETVLPPANTMDLIIVGDPTGAVTTRYQLSSVSIASSQTLLIVGPVEFVVSTTFEAKGNASLVVVDESVTVSKKIGSLTVSKDYPGVGEAKLYVKGDINISGNGSLNAPYKPAALQVFGTLSAAEKASGMTQAIAIGGNGNLTAAFYAPNSEVTLNGGGSSGFFAGAMVAGKVKVNGNGYKFLYDKNLKNVVDPNAYRVRSWAELINANDKYSFPISEISNPDPIDPGDTIDPGAEVSS